MAHREIAVPGMLGRCYWMSEARENSGRSSLLTIGDLPRPSQQSQYGTYASQTLSHARETSISLHQSTESRFAALQRPRARLRDSHFRLRQTMDERTLFKRVLHGRHNLDWHGQSDQRADGRVNIQIGVASLKRDDQGVARFTIAYVS